MARRAGEKSVGSDGAHDDEIYILSGDAGVFHSSPGGMGGHVAGGLIRCGDAALADPRAGMDPFIAGFDYFF